MPWSRRKFVSAGGLALLGGIFVPKYERWFKPNGVLDLADIKWDAVNLGRVHWIGLYDPSSGLWIGEKMDVDWSKDEDITFKSVTNNGEVVARAYKDGEEMWRSTYVTPNGGNITIVHEGYNE